MARKFLVPIDLSVNELQNAVIQNLASDPVSGNVDGRIYYNTASDKLRVYANGSWLDVGAITSVQGTTNEVEVSVVGGVVTIGLPATIVAELNGNAATATKLATARTIELTGDVTGSASFDGSANATITATIATNSVALGTDTTGDYVAGVTASDGIAATGTGEGASVALTNTDKGSSQNIFKNISDGTTSVVADSNNDTVIFSAGTGVSVTANATTDTLTIGNTGVTSIQGTTDQISANNSTGSVTLSLPNAVVFPGTVTLNADPSSALQAATKQYVDSVAQGLHIHPSVQTATTANIADLASAPATIDGVTLTNNMRVLVKNQSTTSQNGVYVYSSSTGALTRADDFNSVAEIHGGDFVFVTGGSTYDNTGWVQTETVTTLGSDPILFQQFSGAGTYGAGNGLTLTGSTFSIDTSITADVNTAQTLSNKTLTSPNISGLYLSDNSFTVEGTANTFETTVSFTDPTADQTITFKDASGTVAFTQDITDAINLLTTSDIEEGTNFYFTDERAQDAVGGIFTSGTTVNLTYVDGTPSISAEVILKASNSYLATTSGLHVDKSALESAFTSDGFTRKYATTITGDNSATSFALTHGLGTADATVQVYDTGTVGSPATAALVETDVTITNTTATILFATAPATNKTYRVVVVG